MNPIFDRYDSLINDNKFFIDNTDINDSKSLKLKNVLIEDILDGISLKDRDIFKSHFSLESDPVDESVIIKDDQNKIHIKFKIARLHGDYRVSEMDYFNKIFVDLPAICKNKYIIYLLGIN